MTEDKVYMKKYLFFFLLFSEISCSEFSEKAIRQIDCEIGVINKILKKKNLKRREIFYLVGKREGLLMSIDILQNNDISIK